MKTPLSTKQFTGLCIALGTAIMLTGCSQGETGISACCVKDGTYSGQSSPDADGTIGKIQFEVEAGRVKNASFTMYDKDGTPHDDNYGKSSSGKITDQEFYLRAQNAISAERQYVTKFEQTGSQYDVERIAGASLSHRAFREAVADALQSAPRVREIRDDSGNLIGSPESEHPMMHHMNEK